MLDGGSHHQAPEEDRVGIGKVVAANIRGLLDTEKREEEDREESGGRQGQTLGHPVQRHDDYAVGHMANLQEEKWAIF